MKKNPFLTMFLLVLCFALWGLVNNMSDNLVPAFQRIFTMDQSKAVLVQVAFYGAYAVLALFTSILVEEFSFRVGILVGLGVYVLGALMYIPACVRQSFDFYFIGIFIVAGGCAILEAASDTCMLAIGDPKSAIRRLNLAQAINPVGSIVGIFLAQKMILAHLNPATVEERLAMSPEQLQPIVHNELAWICVPYVGLCLVMIAIWVYFFRHPLVTTVESGAEKGPLGTRLLHVASALAFTAIPFALTGWLFPDMDKLCWMLCGMIGPFSCIFTIPSYRESFMTLIRTPRYVFGVIALFAYVGMQIAVWTWMNVYGQKELGLPPDVSANYYILAIAIHIVNCWGASYAMKWIAPWKIMAAYCLGGLACSLGTVYLPSTVLFTVAGLPFSANILTLMGCSFFMAILFPTIYGMALGGLSPKCFKLGGPGMVMAILGGAVVTPWMASVISAKESLWFSLVPMMDFAWDANLRTSDGALRASFFIPAICFVAMFVYAIVFRKKESHCMEETLDHILRVKDITNPFEFDLTRPLEIEVGCGKGKFLTERARQNPDCDFLGIERMLERVRLFDGKCRRGKIDNAKVLRLEALYTFHYLLPAHHARTVYVFFPDPWPKKKHRSHRLFGPLFLNALWKRLEVGGKLEFATDHKEYFEAVCQCFEDDARRGGETPPPQDGCRGWGGGVSAPRFERVEPMPRPKEVWTEFETMFREQGLPIYSAAWKSLPADDAPLAPLTIPPEAEPREGIARRCT